MAMGLGVPKRGLTRYVEDNPAAGWTAQVRAELMDLVSQRVQAEAQMHDVLLKPQAEITDADRQLVQGRIKHHLGTELGNRGLLRGVSPEDEAALARQIAQNLLGLGFLEDFLPPARTDLSEIGVNPDGSLWIMPQGATRFELVTGYEFTPAQLMTILDRRVLGPLNLRCNYAEPIVSARLPRDPARGLAGGARVHVVHPRCAIGHGYPDLRIRLFTTEVVRPERLLQWRSLNEEMLGFLEQAVHAYRNIVVIGSTGTGKTTFLNVLSNFIPTGDRVVSIETAQELWLAVDNWTALEEQPANIEGVGGIDSGVLLDAALRMTTQWVVVGEIRSGPAAAKAVLAQSTGHAGLTTLHAESPQIAINVLVQRLMSTREFNSLVAARMAVPAAVQLIVHLVNVRVPDPSQPGAFRQRRLVQEIAQVDEYSGRGDVGTTPLWQYAGDYLDRDEWVRAAEFARWPVQMGGYGFGVEVEVEVPATA